MPGAGAKAKPATSKLRRDPAVQVQRVHRAHQREDQVRIAGQERAKFVGKRPATAQLLLPAQAAR
jgi:hypothetical protein